MTNLRLDVPPADPTVVEGRTWLATERPDGSVFISAGNPTSGPHHAFDVGCDLEMARQICWALNRPLESAPDPH